MYNSFKKQLQKELSEIKKAGLYKEERVITTAQGTDIDTTKNKNVINFCANNYLGLADNKEITDIVNALGLQYGVDYENDDFKKPIFDNIKVFNNC